MEFLDGGKWEIHFPVLFSGNVAQLMNLMGLLIFSIKLGGGGVEFTVICVREKPKL